MHLREELSQAVAEGDSVREKSKVELAALAAEKAALTAEVDRLKSLVEECTRCVCSACACPSF